MENRIDQVHLEGDEDILDLIGDWLTANFRVTIRKKVPLRELFPRPEQKYLLNEWGYGHADLSIYQHGRLNCIWEPGGSNHFRDEAQKLRDQRKDKLCEMNGVNCLRTPNSIVDQLHMKICKDLVRKYIYKEASDGKGN